MPRSPNPSMSPAPARESGWVQVGLAAAAMVGTLPGRTQGLGLITEPLLKDLHLDRNTYAGLNLWATLIGALFAIGIGRTIDRLGSRTVISALVFALGLVTIVMAGVTGLLALWLCLVLTRGLGQGALSVASLTLVGKWFARRLNTAMAAYSILLSIGFMAAFPGVGAAVASAGWRAAWSGLGWALVLALAPACMLFVRSTPLVPPELSRDAESASAALDAAKSEKSEIAGATIWQAMASSGFWAVGLCSAAYGLVASGIGLFNENILAERGLAPSVYHGSLAVTAMTSLAGNFLGGWLTERRPLRWQVRMTAAAMLLLSLSLLALTRITSPGQAYALAAVLGIAGGLVIVVFFAFWARAYGRAHLGQIQGAAQALTVLASAAGPIVLARFATGGSYAPAFYALSVCLALLGLLAWLTPAPPDPPDSPA